MATINVYDENTGTTKTVTVDIDSAVVNGQHTGRPAFFITVSTTAKDPRGNAIPSIVLDDGDITGSVTSAVKAAIVELFRYASGTYLDSTSSSSQTVSESSVSRSSGWSSSSSSTRRVGTSSSRSSVSSSSRSP